MMEVKDMQKILEHAEEQCHNTHGNNIRIV